MPATIDYRSLVSPRQYDALQSPIILPTPTELFDFQVALFEKEGIEFSRQDIDRLRALIPNEPQTFLVVPPEPDSVDLAYFMNLVEFNGRLGHNYLDPEYLTDVGTTPKAAHLLLDVEDGRKWVKTKPSVSFENICHEGRIPYSVWHGIIHSIVFLWVLQHHSLALVGSRYRSSSVPCLGLDRDKVPELGSVEEDETYPGIGAPSAGKMVGI